MQKRFTIRSLFYDECVRSLLQYWDRTQHGWPDIGSKPKFSDHLIYISFRFTNTMLLIVFKKKITWTFEWFWTIQEPTVGQLQSIKSIVILAYQRSGSTFLGSLFNLDPRAFYVFEPLDALYSSLYGTQPGWNIPSNIVTYNNGTERFANNSS